MRMIRCDGAPETVAKLDRALRDTLSGGAALVPLGPGMPPPGRNPGAGQVVMATSSAQPAWVQLSADALRASAEATHARLGGPGRWLLALPVQHIAGLQVLVRSALAGIDAAVLDLSSGFDPVHFGATARRMTGQGRCYTALVPTQLARLLESDPDALTGFDAVLLGGAATPEGLRRRAGQLGVRVVTTYGLTETAGGCVYEGQPLDGVQVRVNATGRIELAGPMLATGYLGDAAKTAATFRDGWLLTSDLGRLNRQGRLQVLGRVDDVIVTGGVNVTPAEVEAVLTGLAGVQAACVVGLPDPEWGQRVAAAIVPTDPAHPPTPRALRAAARRLLTGAQTPKQILLLDALPLCGVGKPDRNAIRALLANARE